MLTQTNKVLIYLLSFTLTISPYCFANDNQFSDKISILISNFEPFGINKCDKTNNETCRSSNMSQLVIEKLAQKIQDDSFLKESSFFDFVSLNVNYSKSVNDLIKKIQTMPARPNIVLSFGEEETEDITFETLGHNRKIDISEDGSPIGYVPHEIYPNFENSIAYNAPLQEMYCALDKKQRAQIKVSVSTGSHVCNSISYQMSQFLRSEEEALLFTDKTINSFYSEYRKEIQNIEQNLNRELSAEERRIALFNVQEITLEKERKNIIDNLLEKNEKFKMKKKKETSKEKEMQEAQKNQETLLFVIPSPYIKRTTSNNSEFIRSKYKEKEEKVKILFQKKIQNFKNARKIIGTLNSARFAFIHLPKSYGQQFPSLTMKNEEDTKVEVLSEKLMIMLRGLVSQSISGKNYDDFPLPSFNNDLRFPLTKEENNLALKKIKEISKNSPMDIEKLKCYHEFLKKQFSSQD